MIQLTKLKKLENNFPVLTGDKALSKKLCDQLIKEIQDMNSFDDTIMGGRSRINKGSKNFCSRHPAAELLQLLACLVTKTLFSIYI